MLTRNIPDFLVFPISRQNRWHFLYQNRQSKGPRGRTPNQFLTRPLSQSGVCAQTKRLRWIILDLADYDTIIVLLYERNASRDFGRVRQTASAVPTQQHESN